MGVNKIEHFLNKKNGKKQQFSDFLTSPIAREIIDREKENNRLWQYVSDKERFYLYDKKGYWRNQNTNYLKKFIREYLKGYNEKWDTSYRVNEIIEAMKSLLLDPEKDVLFNIGYDPDLRHINLQNGMLDWKTGELKPHEFNYFSQCQLPVEYAPGADCPKWEQALEQWVPEKEARMFLQEFTGYCLILDTSLHKAVILHGNGSNGKSTFLNVLKALFGEENLSSIPLHRLSER